MLVHLLAVYSHRNWTITLVKEHPKYTAMKICQIQHLLLLTHCVPQDTMEVVIRSPLIFEDPWLGKIEHKRFNCNRKCEDSSAGGLLVTYNSANYEALRQSSLQGNAELKTLSCILYNRKWYFLGSTQYVNTGNKINKKLPFCMHHRQGSFPAEACHQEWSLALSPRRQAAAFWWYDLGEAAQNV